MKNAISSIEDYESLLDGKESDLILQREKVWRFLNTDHNVLDVKKYQIQVRKSEIELGRIQRELMDGNGVASQFRSEMKALCERIRALGAYTKSMDDALSHDLLEKRIIEDRKSIDVIKYMTFVLAVPVTFMTAVKDGLFGGHVNLYQAAGAGLGISTTILARKRIVNAFRSVGRSVYAAPHRVKNSYFLFYTWQTLREKAAVAEAAISDPAGFVTAVVKRGTANGKLATFQKPQL